MLTNERLLKLATADAATLARVDAALNHDYAPEQKREQDCRLITFTEAARRLGLSRPTVYRLAKTGRLETVPLNGVSRIKLQSVVDFFKSGVK